LTATYGVEEANEVGKCTILSPMFISGPVI
jgi:hypothetical protein